MWSCEAGDVSAESPRGRQVSRLPVYFCPLTWMIVDRLTCGHTLSNRHKTTDGQREGQIKMEKERQIDR